MRIQHFLAVVEGRIPAARFSVLSNLPGKAIRFWPFNGRLRRIYHSARSLYSSVNGRNRSTFAAVTLRLIHSMDASKRPISRNLSDRTKTGGRSLAWCPHPRSSAWDAIMRQAQFKTEWKLTAGARAGKTHQKKTPIARQQRAKYLRRDYHWLSVKRPLSGRSTRQLFNWFSVSQIPSVAGPVCFWNFLFRRMLRERESS